MDQARTALAFALLVLGCGGGTRAPAPPVRTSPQLILVDDTTHVTAIDPRTGVFTDSDRLLRIEGDPIATITTLTTGVSADRVRSFDGGTWIVADSAGSPTMRIEPDGSLTRFVGADCVAAAPDSGLTMHDARSPSDAWATLFHDGEVLCHFDGTAWSAETVPFYIDTLVATVDALFAVDRSGIPRLMRRSLTGGEWTQIPEGELGGDPMHVEPTPNGAVAQVTGLAEVDGELVDTTRVTVLSPELEVLDSGTFFGLDGTRWRVETLVGEGQECSNGVWSSGCSSVIEWVQYVLRRDGAEVAHIMETVGFDARAEPILVDADRVAIATPSGIWITP